MYSIHKRFDIEKKYNKTHRIWDKTKCCMEIKLVWKYLLCYNLSLENNYKFKCDANVRVPFLVDNSYEVKTCSDKFKRYNSKIT